MHECDVHTHTHIIRNIFKRERTVKIVGAWMHL